MRRVGFVVLWLLCGLVALYAAQYWSGWTFVPGFEPFVNGLGVLPLAIHASFGSIALLVGPFQFSSRLRAAHPRVHRFIGRTYVLGCLVSGTAGLALAFGSQETLVAKAGFGSLAVLWLTTTGLGLRLAAAGRIAEHRRWMWRSMALTFAAVTLRFMLPAGLASGAEFSQVYAVIAWLCWVPNLLAAELYLRAAPAAGRQRAAS